MENQQLPQGYDSYRNDEITLKELLLKLLDYYWECIRNWKIIILFAVPFMGYQLWLRFTEPVYYSASLTFMVNDTKGSSMGGILGQLSSLSGQQEDKLEKILGLAKSRKNLGNALLKQGVVNGNLDYYANHLIRIQGLNKDWKEDSLMNGFLFTRGNVDSFSVVENKVLRSLYKILIGSEKKKPIFTTNSSKETGIMTFKLQTNSQDLTIGLLKVFFYSLSDLYIQNSTLKETEVFGILSQKKDSLERVLFRNDVATASHEDQSNNLLLQRDKVPAKRYARDNLILTTLYAEVVKNTEMAEFALKTATPYVSILDEPIPPIVPVRKGGLKDIALFSIVGLVVGCLFIIMRKILRDTLKTDE